MCQKSALAIPCVLFERKQRSGIYRFVCILDGTRLIYLGLSIPYVSLLCGTLYISPRSETLWHSVHRAPSMAVWHRVNLTRAISCTLVNPDSPKSRMALRASSPVHIVRAARCILQWHSSRINGRPKKRGREATRAKNAGAYRRPEEECRAGRGFPARNDMKVRKKREMLRRNSLFDLSASGR